MARQPARRTTEAGSQSTLPGCERPAEPLGIHQRRYLGGKQTLVPFIAGILGRELGRVRSFFDVFAGTGAVAAAVNETGVPVLVNELLYSNYVALDAFLGPGALDLREYRELVAQLAALRPDAKSYAAREWGGRYFGAQDAARIGAVRDAIERSATSGRLRAALLATLIYAADRVAHTCGHYDAYRAGDPEDSVFRLRPLALPPARQTKRNGIFNGDANELALKVAADVAYLDPPYNSRQYADAYHVLENLALWQKPPLEGKARKFDRSGLKSRYNLKDAPKAFAELVGRLRCRAILVSYNNMGTKGDPRSQNRIDDAELLEALRGRGEVQVFSQPFRAFSAGRGTVEDHEERVFLCRVERPPVEEAA